MSLSFIPKLSSREVEQIVADEHSHDLAMLAWPDSVKHVSASSLKTFVACPEQYRRRYLLGQKRPPSAALVWGRADHKAAEHNYRQKLTSGIDVAEGEIVDAFHANVEQTVEETGGAQELDWSSPKDQSSSKRERAATVDDIHARGEKMAVAYHRLAAPTVQPVAVEERFEVTVAGVPVPLVGYVDLIAEPVGVDPLVAVSLGVDVPEPGPRIIDKKGVAKRLERVDPEMSFQGAIYQLARWLPHDWHISVKTKAPYVLVGLPGLTIEATDERKAWVERAIRSLLNELGECYVKYGAHEPWPATRALLHSWRCQYCGYEPDCAWRKGAA